MTKSNLDVQAVFMDRDGTIGGTGHFIHPRDFELYPNAKEALMLLKTCPHEQECSCRKPKPGMLLYASEQHDLDLSKCVVIGDVGDTDMLAAHAVGAIKIMVKTGWGESSLTKFRDTWSETEPDYVAEHILDAVQWIIRGPE